ncbi:MAG: hypothetical protein NWE78_00695 [Candidatus Bathyarchaeota archaeon]|nr:hypothetical protein [Candidatus Bathyarchaeota archaeon]
MKKTIFLGFLLSALFALLCTSAVRPAIAYTYDHNWIGQTHDDPFWGIDNLVVFPEYTTAILTVTVRNTGANDLNISSVKVYMDWGTNYSSAECSEANPAVITPSAQYRTFTIALQVPSSSAASNLFMHHYTIYVYEVNATAGPQEVKLHDQDIYSGFVVYSTDQKDSMTLRDEILLLDDIYDGSPWYYPSQMHSIDARSLWENYTIHYEMGEYEYSSGLFDQAKTHYALALDLLEQAITTELAYDLDEQLYQDSFDRQMQSLETLWWQANISYTGARANATLRNADATYALAQAAITQAYAWIVFGIGFVVFGLAAVVWAYKKPDRKPQ